MKVRLGILILSLLVLFAASGCAIAFGVASNETETYVISDEVYVDESRGIVTLATTASVADSGLLTRLQELFQEQTGWALDVIAVTSGEALEMGRQGEVDVILTHDRPSEIVFVAEGFGIERYAVMYNDFVIIGPEDIIPESHDIEAAFQLIYEERLPFISSAYDSGSNRREMFIWNRLNIDPHVNPAYQELAYTVAETMDVAEVEWAFSFTDRGTWLSFLRHREDESSLKIIVSGDRSYYNQYGVIAINPEIFPNVNVEGAREFILFLTSEEIQILIAGYGFEEFGEPIFFPAFEQE